MLELTGWCRHGDSLANLGPKTPNNMGSSCEKKYDHRQFSFVHFFITLSPFEITGRKQCSWTLSLKYWSFSFDMTSRLPKHYSDLPRHPPDTFQTHSRHTLDIVFYPIEGSRKEYIMLVFCKQPSISCLPTVRCQHYCWTARMAAWQATPSTCACGWWLQSTIQSLGIRTSSSYNSLMRGEPM